MESGEGTAVILLCTVESNPPARLTLLKGEKAVASSAPAGGARPGQSGRVPPQPNALRLELRAPSEEDEGGYECLARSPLGSARASLSLQVQGESHGWDTGPLGGVMWARRGTARIVAAVGHRGGRERCGAGGRAGWAPAPLRGAPTAHPHPAEGGRGLGSR